MRQWGDADDAAAGLERSLRRFARERVGGVEDEVELPAECCRVKVELDDRVDTELSRGFEATMVADIAERATARTFFRYFADKREVLFDGSTELAEKSLAVVEAMPASASVMDVVAAVLDDVAQMVGGTVSSRGRGRR